MNDFLIWGMIFFSMGFALSLLRSMVLRPPRRIRVDPQDFDINSVPIKITEGIDSDEILTRWYLNGVPHREDGPAVEYPSGVKEWYLNGKRHRENGPAIEYPDGSKEWWHHGLRTKVEWTLGGKNWWEEKGEKDARREEFEHENYWH